MNRDLSIIGYVRGARQTFAERPLCHADLLVFSMLSFLRFERLQVQGALDGAASLSELSERVPLSDLAIDVLSTDKVRQLAAAVSTSLRFGPVKILDFSALHDLSVPAAFAACAFLLPEDAGSRVVLAFRGTEEEQECWQEDFEFVTCTETPSERAAVSAFNRCAAKADAARFALTGFSKGGALAERAALFGNEGAVSRIDEVVSFDGNGLFRLGSPACPEFRAFDEELTRRYELCDAPMTKYLTPALVGLMLERREEVQLRVLCGAEGGFAHDPFFPAIENGQVKTRSLERGERARGMQINRWVERLSLEERHAVISVIFALESESSKRFVVDDWRALLGVAASALRGLRSVGSRQRQLFLRALAKVPSSLEQGAGQ